MGYKAVSRLKVSSKDDEGPAEYIDRGESVSESDVDDFDALVKGGSIVTDERYDQLFPKVQEGSNQAWGTPSNLEQIEGTDLQMNPPEEGDEVPTTRVFEGNPADVPVVEGAPTPGDNSDSAGQDSDEADEDDDTF